MGSRKKAGHSLSPLDSDTNPDFLALRERVRIQEERRKARRQRARDKTRRERRAAETAAGSPPFPEGMIERAKAYIAAKDSNECYELVFRQYVEVCFRAFKRRLAKRGIDDRLPST